MRRYGGRESTRFARALSAPAVTPSGDAGVDELVDLTQRLSRVDTVIDIHDRPDPAFRAQTRQRLLALAEQRTIATDQRPSPRTTDARRHAPVWGRRVALAVAVLSAVLATAGLLTLVSRTAVPGDALYAAKRGAEQVQLGLTWDRDERGLTLLHFAEIRLDEVTELVEGPVALRQQQQQAASPGLPLAAGGSHEAVVSTLAEMDRQTAAGISLLTTSAVKRSNQATLGILPTWAEGQQSLLGALVEQMTPAEQDRAQVSMALLDRVDQRAQILGSALRCECLDASPTDELGPLPCASCRSGPGGPPSSSATATPTDPGADPTGSTPSPTDPDADPTDGSATPTDPGADLTGGSASPTPTDPSADPTGSTPTPTDPGADPTDGSATPTDPGDGSNGGLATPTPTDPGADPTDGSATPTPTDPGADPTDSSPTPPVPTPTGISPTP